MTCSAFTNARGAGNGLGFGLVNVLVAVAVAGVLLVALMTAMATYIRGSQGLDLRTRAEELLFSRAASLASMPLTSVPADGLYGAGDLAPHLEALLTPAEEISFRLEIRRVPQEYPNYFWPDAPPRTFRDFVRFRLRAGWFTRASDVVLLRSLDPAPPVADDEKETP